MQRETRVSKAGATAIVSQICMLLIQGVTKRQDLFKVIKEKENLTPEIQVQENWHPIGNVSENMIDRWIGKARIKFELENQENRAEVKAFCFMKLKENLERAERKDSVRGVNQTIEKIMYLHNLGGMNVHNTFDPVQFDVKLTEDEEADYNKRLKSFYKGIFPESEMVVEDAETEIIE